MDYTIAAIDRALKLLEIVAEKRSIGLSELTRLSGTTKTLAFRMATTLEARGYLLKDPEERAPIRSATSRFISASRCRTTHRWCARQSFLDELSARTRENVSLLVRDGLARLPCHPAIAAADPSLRRARPPGPLHVGGGPKLLLALRPTRFRRRSLPRR